MNKHNLDIYCDEESFDLSVRLQERGGACQLNPQLGLNQACTFN